ncbi:hypothetical protein KCU88_g2783, partial [Aureobasidium melanogenum]
MNGKQKSNPKMKSMSDLMVQSDQSDSLSGPVSVSASALSISNCHYWDPTNRTKASSGDQINGSDLNRTSNNDTLCFDDHHNGSKIVIIINPNNNSHRPVPSLPPSPFGHPAPSSTPSFTTQNTVPARIDPLV